MNARTFLAPLLALALYFGLLLAPIAAEDMDTILNQHDPSDGSTSATTTTTTTAPATPPAGTPATGPTAADVDKILDTIEKLVKMIEGLTEIIADTGKNGNTSETPAKDKFPCEGTVRVNTSLNIRTGPWGTIIGSYHNGDKVRIIGREGAWYKISRNGQTVYCHANYIDAPGAPAGQTPIDTPGSNRDSRRGTDHASTPPATGQGRFGAAPCSPMPSSVSSEFGMRRHPTTGEYRMHNGVDLPVPNGTRLNALGDGVVTSTGYESGGGRFIIVRYDNGLESFYCHLQSVSVREGQRVSMGQEICRSDNTGQWTTGAHLHMGIKKNGQYINPRSVLKLP